MKGSDKVKMSINIGGEIINLDVGFDDQNNVRDAEREVKLYIEKLRKAWPENSDRKIIAMAAYQFAKWYHRLLKIQNEALEIVDLKNKELADFSRLKEESRKEEDI